MPVPRRRLTPEARRLEILEAAEKLLRRDGTAVRVEDIVAEAGASKGTFFVCFATWDDMLDAVRARLGPEYAKRVPPVPDPAIPRDWTRVLPDLAAAVVDFVLSMDKLHEVLFHSAFTLARPLPPERKPAAHIAAVLRAGQAAGAFPALDNEAAANLIFAMIHETADAVAAGADRERMSGALDAMLRRAVPVLSPPAENDAALAGNPRAR